MLIHFSTDYILDGRGDRPWREEDSPHPLGAYGASKLAGEKAVRSADGTHLIVRTSWVYAAQGSNFLRTIVHLARERKELRIVADQVGAPTSAALIACAVVAMLSKGNAALHEYCARCDGVVHLAASGATSWHGFALAIVDGLRRRRQELAVNSLARITLLRDLHCHRRPDKRQLNSESALAPKDCVAFHLSGCGRGKTRPVGNRRSGRVRKMRDPAHGVVSKCGGGWASEARSWTNWHASLLPNRGYDANWIRALAAERGARANNQPTRNHSALPRNLLKQSFNNIKRYQRVASAITSLRPITGPSSRRSQYRCGFELMGPRSNTPRCWNRITNNGTARHAGGP